LWTVTGDAAYDELGNSCATIGDFTGDGIPEIIGGAPYDQNNGQDCGLIRVYDGATGIIIHSFDGNDMSDELGRRVAGPGDIDGDGLPDFMAAAPNDEIGGALSGTVTVYSGQTAIVLHTLVGSAGNEKLGSSMDYIGDVDGDGNDDLLIGATEKGSGASAMAGFVKVFSGATGAVLYTVNGLAANDQFGYAVAGGRDINNDGVPDFLAGAYGQDTNGTNAGSVSAHSGADGSMIWTAFGDSARDHLGNSVSFIGDVNGDGVADAIAGALEDDNNATNCGSVRIFDGATGAVITTLNGSNANDHFGYSVSDLGDLSGDGIEEFMVGVYGFDGLSGKDSGMIVIYNGATMAVHGSVEGTLGDDRLGTSMDAAGDMSGDGSPDFISGGRQRGGAAIGNGQGFITAFDPSVGPPPPPIHWPNLPTAFVPLASLGSGGYADGFESYAGIMPTHMAANALNSLSRLADPDAWCNIGQMGIVSGPHAGAYGLELGGAPVMSSYHDVSNGLVIGIDGTGSTSLVLDYWAINFGEENHSDDGIWLSNDGANWERVQTNWGHVTPGMWMQVMGVDLTATSVDTQAPFYLMFAQQDNYEYGSADGIGIDDIHVHEPAPAGPTLAMTPNPPVAGGMATFDVTNNAPGDLVIIAYSLTGGGPTSTMFGTAELSPPFYTLPYLTANASGLATITAFVPFAVQGMQIWVQALNRYQVLFTNGITFTVQ